MPTKLGTLVSQYLKLDADINEQEQELSRKLKPKKEKLDELETQIIEAMKKEKLTEFGGTGGRLIYNRKAVPTVKDWNELYKYIKKNDAFFLLEKRTSVTAYREILDSGQTLPGVETFFKESLTLSRKKGDKGNA